MNPSYVEINRVLRVATYDIVKKYNGIFILPDSQDADPDANDIIVIQAFKPENIETLELGGRIGSAQQYGNYIVTLSIVRDNNDDAVNAWNIASDLRQALRFTSLDTNTDKCVYINEPYVTNVGITPDERLSLQVTIPWMVTMNGD